MIPSKEPNTIATATKIADVVMACPNMFEGPVRRLVAE